MTLSPAEERRVGAGACALLIVAASALVLILGLARQPSDPPRDLSISLGVFDEGIWSHNAANEALFGKARLDDFNPRVVTSGSLLYRASYAIAGVGITQTRLPSIVLGAAAVLLVGFMLWREDAWAGVAGAWLLGGSYLFLAYTRLGLLETPAIAFLLGGLFCVVLGLTRERPGLSVLGGALLAAAVTIKIQAAASVVGAVAGLVLWYILEGKRTRENGTGLLSTFGGLAGGAAIWIVYVFTHRDAAARAEWSWHSAGVAPRIGDIPSNVAAYLRDSDGVGTFARPILIAAVCGLVVQIVAWALKRWRPGPLALAAAGWAAAGMLALAMLPYTPSRYAILALPGLALVAGNGLIAARVLTPASWNRIVPILALAAVALAAGLGIEGWIDRKPTYDLRRTARMLARETRTGDVILGGFALIPSLQTYRQIIITREPGINDRCPVERFGVDWVLLNEGNRGDRAFYDARYPGLDAPANRVATASVLGRRLGLYRVPAGTKGVGCA